MNNEEILKFAIENGMLDLSNIREQVDMQKRKEYIENHPYNMWQGNNGKWYTYTKDDVNGRKLLKRNSKKELEDAIVKYYKEQELNPTFYDIFHAWNDRRKEFNEISENSYDKNNSTFQRHFSEFGKKKIKNITSKDIVDFLREENSSKGLTSKAYSSLKGIVKGCIEYTLENDLISDDEYTKIVTRLDNLKLKHRRIIKEEEDEVFSEDEIRILFNYFKDNMDNVRNVGLLLMMATGMRVGELSALKFDDFSDNSVKIRRTESKKKTNERNKQGKFKYEYFVKDFPKTKDSVRTIIISNDFSFIIKDILRRNTGKSEYAFTYDNGKRMTTMIFLRRLYTACEQCGIKRKSCHKFRKTYISILLDNNVDANMIKQQVGHADISTSEMYYHRNRKTIEKKVEILSQIEEFSMLCKA